MNKLNKILVGVLGLQVVLLAVVLLTRDRTSIGELKPLLPGVTAEKIGKVQIFPARDPADPASGDGKKPADGKPAIVLSKGSAGWTLDSHDGYPVKKEQIEELLGKLAGMRARQPLTTGATRHRQLKVGDDVYQRKIVISADGKEITLFLGDNTEIRRVAVRLAGSEEVYSVDGLSATAASTDATAWVDTAYVDLREEEIAALTVVNGAGTFEMRRTAKDAPFTVKTPAAPSKPGELDQEKIKTLVRKAGSIRLSEPAGRQDRPEYGLDRPSATLTIELFPAKASGGADAGPATGGQTPETAVVVVGAKADSDYHVRRLSAPYTVKVHQSAVSDFVELKTDAFYKAPEANKPAEGGAAPSGLPAGLPPGMMPGGDLPPGH
jgi:hypothetical protein